MLKKSIIALLLLVMTVSFAACEDKPEPTVSSSGSAAVSQSDTTMTFAATVDVKGKWTFSANGHSYILTFYDDNTVEFISNSSSGIDGLFHGRWSMSANEVTLELSDTLTEAAFTSVLTANRADPQLTLTWILGEPLISGFDYGQPMVFTAAQ
ncbi:MAG: hypothetical protein IJP10_05350 [Clostridia bacterium]|nr:hypothetical protein [Clostridia bacterium]